MELLYMVCKNSLRMYHVLTNSFSKELAKVLQKKICLLLSLVSI